LDWAWGWEQAADGVVIEVTESPAVERTVAGSLRAWGGRLRYYVTRHAVVARAVAAAGVVADARVALDAVGLPTATPQSTREAVRARLGCTAADVLMVILPPIERVAGAFNAAWGAMVGQKVAPALRMVMAGSGRDVDRVQRLVQACQHESMMTRATGAAEWTESLRAADVAVALHAATAPLYGAATALALGVPLIATPTVRAGLGTATLAAVCQPDGPKDVARALLDVIDARLGTQTPALRRAFRASDVVAAYAAVYAGQHPPQ